MENVEKITPVQCWRLGCVCLRQNEPTLRQANVVHARLSNSNPFTRDNVRRHCTTHWPRRRCFYVYSAVTFYFIIYHLVLVHKLTCIVVTTRKVMYNFDNNFSAYCFLKLLNFLFSLLIIVHFNYWFISTVVIMSWRSYKLEGII